MRRIILVLLLLCYAPLAWATTYYVSPTGNDTTGDGSSVNPWRNPQRCVTTVGVSPDLVTGDICTVADGTYTDHDGDGFVVWARASIGSPSGITIKATNRGGATIVVPDTAINTTGPGMRIEMANYTIDGFVVTDNGVPTTQPVGVAHHGIFFAAGGTGGVAQFNTFHHIARNVCSTNPLGNTGVYVEAATGTIQDNLFYTIGRKRVGEGGCGASVTGDQNDHGIYTAASSAGTHTIRRNVFYDVNRGFPIQLHGLTSGTDVYLYNNTLADKSSTGAPAGQVMFWGLIGTVTAKNNIFYDPQTAPFTTYQLTCTAINYTDNLTDNGDADLFVSSAPGCATGSANDTSTSPGFMNAGTRDYRLAAGSAAINAGVNVGLPYSGSAPDIGAHESPTTYYVDTGCGNGITTYVPATRACTGGSATSYTTIANGLTPTVAGDTLYIRTGTYAVTIDPSGKNGSAGSVITIAGYPGETVTIAPPAGLNLPIAMTPYTYFAFDNLIFDGVNQGSDTSGTGTYGIIWREYNHHITLTNSRVTRMWNSNILIGKTGGSVSPANITLQNVQSDSARSDGGVGRRGYGVYVHDCGTCLIENSEFHDNPGGALQAYPGPMVNLTFRNNRVHDENTVVGYNGATLFGTNTDGINHTNTLVYNNRIYHNGYHAASVEADGIEVFGDVDGIKIWNNTIYDNSGSGTAYGIRVDSRATNVTIQNNLIFGNKTGSICFTFTDPTCTSTTSDPAVTATHNACPTAHSCGTSKVDLISLLDCAVSASDFHLKPGTNVCRDTGTTVAAVTTDLDGAARPFGYGYDIGADEFVGAIIHYVDGNLPGGVDCAGGAGTSYIVIGTGARTCGGSNGQPAWNTVQEGLRALRTRDGVGDVLYIRGGSYTMTAVYGNTMEDTFGCVTPTGTTVCPTSWANAVKVTNYPGEIVSITHRGINFDADVLGLKSYFIWEGETRTRMIHQVANEDFDVIRFDKADHIRIKTTTIRGTAGQGIQVAGNCTNVPYTRSRFIEIIDNLITENGDAVGAGPIHDHGLYASCFEDLLVQGNTFYKNWGYGFHGNAQNSLRATVTGNIFEGRGAPTGTSACIYANGISAFVATYNLCIGQGTAPGQFTHGIQVSPTSPVALLYHNTFVGMAGAAIQNWAPSVRIFNNLFSQFPDNIELINAPAGVVAGGNLCSFADLTVAGACAVVTATPGFTTPGLDYTLAPGSPAIDAGTILGAPYTYNGGAPDIGYAETGVDSTAPGSPANFAVQ